MCTCHYKQRLADTLAMLELQEDDVVHLISAHDEYCGVYADACCDCHPRLCIQTRGGEITVSEDGQVTMQSLN
jgi:hypothetical protein